MARSKPKGRVIATMKQASDALKELCEIERELSSITDQMNADIDAIKATAEKAAEPHLPKKKEIEQALAAFGQQNKDELFKKPKSKTTLFGVIGFRKSTKLVTLPKVKLSDVLVNLKKYNFKRAIKNKESVNKEAMRLWPAKRLERVGMKRISTDEFFIEFKAEDLGQKG